MNIFLGILANNYVDEQLGRQEDEIVGDLEEHRENQATEEVSDRVRVGESFVKYVINKNKEFTSSVAAFF